MHIFIDATPVQSGHRERGIGTYTRELLRALLAWDRTNRYSLLAYADAQQELAAALGALPANATLIFLPRPPLGRWSSFFSHQIALPRLLAHRQADLFHAPGFVAAFSVAAPPWRCPQPLVITLHDLLPLHLPALYNGKALNRWWYQRQMQRARRAAHLICVSEATRHDAVALMGAEAARCSVVYEGVDRQRFYPASPPPIADASPFILFVGGNYPHKNRTAALAAFARLCQTGTLPHRLLLVGPDEQSEAELAQRFPQLDLSRIERRQRAEADELATLYRQADLFLFPSVLEGFGLPVLEAMASGTPVIAANAGPLPEVAGDAAVLVDASDDSALAAAMQRVLADRMLHARLRSAGLARAAAFTWQETARQTVAVYEKVLRGEKE